MKKTITERCPLSGVLLDTGNKLHAAVERKVIEDDGAARVVRVSLGAANMLDRGMTPAEIRAYAGYAPEPPPTLQ